MSWKKILNDKFFEALPLLILINTFALIFYWTKLSVNVLFYLIPLVIIVNLIVILFSFAFSAAYFKENLKKIKKRTWIILILIFIGGFSLRAFVVPSTHRLLFDEDIYLNIAQNIANEGKSILCNYGTPHKCFQGILNKQPNGLSVIISPVFFVFGAGEQIASFFMILLSSFSIVLIFISVYLWFRNEKGALFAALIMSLNPISLLFAPTISAESAFVFFSLVTLMSLRVFLDKRDIPSIVFFVSSLAFPMQMRPEAPLLAAPFVLFFIKEKIDRKIILGSLLFLVFISPYVFHSKHFLNESWGNPEGYKFSSKYINNNLKVNGSFFFDNQRFPIAYTFLAFLGIVYLYRSRKIMELSSMLIWFLLFFIIYLLFYAGSFNYGIDVRFSQMLFVPVFILGGMGAYFIPSLMVRFVRKKYISGAIVGTIITLSFIPYIGFVSAIGEEAWDARTDHDFSINATKELGANCVIFTHVPSMFLVNGNNALQTSYYSNPEIVNNIFINYDCVLFHEGYWCVNYKPFRDTVCKSLKQNFSLKVYKSMSVRDKTYILYNMTKK